MIITDHPITLDLGDLGIQRGGVTAEVYPGAVRIISVVWFQDLGRLTKRVDITASAIKPNGALVAYIREEIFKFINGLPDLPQGARGA